MRHRGTKAVAPVPIGDRRDTDCVSRRNRSRNETRFNARDYSTIGTGGEAGARRPTRSDIDPADIRHVLGDTFMLAADFVDDIRFRLAGTRVCALFAREIKGEAFNAQWSETSSEHIEDLLAAVINEKIGVVAGIIGRTEDGAEVELELLLLPLAHAGQTRVRALGVLAPLDPALLAGRTARC